MATGAAMKKVGSPFANEEKIIRTVYDFSKDGGAVSAIDLFTASQACLLTGFTANVLTTATSGGSATVSVGYTGAATGLLTATAVASLTAGSVFGENGAFDQVKKLAVGDTVSLNIAVAALTAGKIEVMIKVQKAS